MTAKTKVALTTAAACVAIGGAKNAALLAIQILALDDAELLAKFKAYKQSLAQA